MKSAEVTVEGSEVIAKDDIDVANDTARVVAEIKNKQKELENLLKVIDTNTQQFDYTPESSPLDNATDNQKTKESIKELIQREKCKYKLRMQSSEESLSQIKEKIRELTCEEDTFMDSYSHPFAAAFDEELTGVVKPTSPKMETSNLKKAPKKSSHKRNIINLINS